MIKMNAKCVAANLYLLHMGHVLPESCCSCCPSSREGVEPRELLPDGGFLLLAPPPESRSGVVRLGILLLLKIRVQNVGKTVLCGNTRTT
jgi:hypothetical protein